MNKEKKNMSEPLNNNTEEIALQLLAEIRKAKGHKLVQLTGMYNKLTNPKQSPPKSTGTAVDELPPGEQALHRVVMVIEAEDRERRRAGLPVTTSEERKALIYKTLTAEEIATIEAEHKE